MTSELAIPETRYAESDGLSIAYQVFGSGAQDLVVVPGIVSNAGAGEVLVSSTVKDLVAGSGITFEERGSHALNGVPGEWRLFRALAG